MCHLFWVDKFNEKNDLFVGEKRQMLTHALQHTDTPSLTHLHTYPTYPTYSQFS